MPDPPAIEPPPNARAGAERRALAVVLLLLVAWGGFFIARTTFNLHVKPREEVGSHALVLSRLRELQKLVAAGARVVTYWAGTSTSCRWRGLATTCGGMATS